MELLDASPTVFDGAGVLVIRQTLIQFYTIRPSFRVYTHRAPAPASRHRLQMLLITEVACLPEPPCAIGDHDVVAGFPASSAR